MKYIFQELDKDRMYYFCIVMPTDENAIEWFSRNPPRYRPYFGSSQRGFIGSLEQRLNCEDHKLILKME